MRSLSSSTVVFRAAFACSALFSLSATLVGCGNGDDTTVPTPKAASDASSDATVGDASGADGGATLKHIYVIMMENHAQAQIVGDTTDAPKLNALAQKYGVAKQYFGVTHPSLPNYLAAISGDFQGIYDDCPAGPGVTCPPEEFVVNSGDGTSTKLMTQQQFDNASSIPHWFSGATIVDQLEEHGLTWKAYMGDLIATGDVNSGAPIIPTADGGTEDLNLYAQKHNPFEYFESIRTNANRMNKIVPYTSLAADLAGTTAPNFVWISPDQCSDMHGINADTAAFADAGFCTGTAAGNDMSAAVIQYGDAFVGNLVTQIMAAPTWNDGSAIAIVFDEDDYVDTSGCCNSPTGVDGGVLGGALVPAIVVSSLVPGPVASGDPYNHYSLLATIQQMWGLGCLANTCGMTGSKLMTSLFLPSESGPRD